MSRGALLGLTLLAGCLPGREVLEPVAAAWGVEVAAEAQPAAQAALGLSAVASILCGYSLEEWEGMGAVAPSLPADVAGIFDLEGEGALRAYSARGQYTCTWAGGSFFDREITLRAAVETPTSAFTLSLEEPGSGEDHADDTGEPSAVILASMGLGTSRCGTTERVVSGQGSFPVGGLRGWVVASVAGEDTGGLAFAPGASIPIAGGLAWSGITDVGRATLTTHDAAEIDGDRWPATAGGAGWSSEIFLDLP